MPRNDADHRGPAGGAHGRGFTAYLVATTMIAGAIVMVIEVLGSRVLGPFFGVSVFVWTSLITVTLAALAIGYAVGGRIADRYPAPDTLYLLLLGAGALTLLIPALRPFVLESTARLGLRLGALASATLLFGPALLLLGCVTPCIVRLAVRALQTLGTTVGAFYAASTLGSIAGTVLAGFYLVPTLGVSRVFFVSGVLLIAVGVGYFVVYRRRLWAAAALALPMATAPAEVARHAVMADGTRVSVVHQEDTRYASLKVIEYHSEAMRTRELTIDGLVQGGVDVGSGLSVYENAYLMQWLPVALRPGGRTGLVIGLGAGIVPRWYAAQGVQVDVVDIDPAVVAVAQAYFGYARGADVAVEDGRAFLRRGSARYDYVVLDVYTGDTTPAHLLSIEALRLLKSRLSERGVLALNLVGSLREHTLMTASVVHTLHAAFDNVSIYTAFDPAHGSGVGNLVMLAYDGAPASVDVRALSALPVHPLAGKSLRHALARPFAFPPGTPALLLTDDHNPIDVRDLWLKERLRRQILDSTPHRVL